MGTDLVVPNLAGFASAPAGESTRWRTLSDYASLTKPAITLLIVLVGVGGYFVANPAVLVLSSLLVLVAAGASASAGAAMLNHYFDRDLDRTMRRTRSRPLAAARITSERSVLASGLALTALGWGSAAWLLNPLAAFSIALGSATYVGVYTLWLKRRTSWNIVVGGFAGSAPALAGSAAAVGHWTLGALALALLLFLWTPPHFWSLALMLREDYQRARLPMLPRMADPRHSGRVVVLSAALLIPAAALVALWGGSTPAVAGVLLVASGIFLLTTFPLLRRADRAAARRGFIASGPYLLAILLALSVGWFFLHTGLPARW